MGSGAKSYMRNGFLVCANISSYMRRPLVIYDFAPNSSELPIPEENFISFFISAATCTPWRAFAQY